jgi:hypothetical protein
MIRETAGIGWPLAATVGHITVTTSTIRGTFPANAGTDARLCCELVPAGKYRNGAARSWCRTHQAYWGVKADLAALDLHGERRCARHADPMGYALDPLVIDLRKSLPTTLPTASNAVALVYDPASRLFDSDYIAQINVTPPAMRAMAYAAGSGQALGCVSCARCRHPHLDLGTFAQRSHRRHTCGHCGHDATHSGAAMISNPLFPLLQAYGEPLRLVLSTVQGGVVL